MTELDPSVFVHETALVETAEIGARTRLWAFTHILDGARVGDDCNLREQVRGGLTS